MDIVKGIAFDILLSPVACTSLALWALRFCVTPHKAMVNEIFRSDRLFIKGAQMLRFRCESYTEERSKVVYSTR